MVPGVSVTVTGVTVGFSRTVKSDLQGEFRVQQIPIGSYNVTTAATSGFSATKTSEVTVAIENATLVNIRLSVSTTAESVVVAADAPGPNVDTSDSKVQTNITKKLIDQLPKGTSFDSLLKISPATRAEGRAGGFQVDGASGSENAFIIDGLSIENFRTGTLNGVNNLPTSLVSEIQIKTGGFEAEHGGASGGVISVVTKSGSDSFHGELSSAFELSGLQPGPRFTLQRFVNSNASPAAIANNPDYVYVLPQKKDRFANLFPTAIFSGPVIKGRLWFLGNYSPQVFRATRVSNFINALSNADFSTGRFVPSPRLSGGTPLAPLTYKRNIKSEYAFGRLDGAISDNLRASVTYLWNPEITDGDIPFDSITTSNPVATPYAGILYSSDQYARLRGGRTNSNNITSQLSWTPTGRLVATFRYGRAFLNQKGGSYGLNDIPRYVCGGSQAAYGTTATGCPGGRGFQNILTNNIPVRDVSIKNEYNGDVSYFVNGFGGSHEFKGGYQYGRTSNDVLSGNAETGTVTLQYGLDYAGAGTGVSLPCSLGSASCIGIGTLARAGSKGVARNNYH
ncbi:MAG TPA: carboxypeptidase regulatory-like domain-containing protein, partial [Blastocatellia bacterium]|nr:carboxypeptidase regulatory-like domain-containing protein [Blastocatellia bacterium]